MKKAISLTLAGMFLAASVSLPVSAAGNNNANSGNGGGFGQTYCKLPSGDVVFVPWFYCKAKDGQGDPADF